MRRLTCKRKITDAREPPNVSTGEQDESVRKTPVQESNTERNPGCGRRVTVFAKKNALTPTADACCFLPEAGIAFPPAHGDVACITKSAVAQSAYETGQRHSSESRARGTDDARLRLRRVWGCIGCVRMRMQVSSRSRTMMRSQSAQRISGRSPAGGESNRFCRAMKQEVDHNTSAACARDCDIESAAMFVSRTAVVVRIALRARHGVHATRGDDRTSFRVSPEEKLPRLALGEGSRARRRSHRHRGK
jgi:hypothetical protein